MAESAASHATYEDLVGVPDNMIGEIVHGTLVTQPRPDSLHAWVATVLNEELGGPFRRGHAGPGQWMLLFEPELHLGADVLVPDMAGWRRERLPEMPEASFFTLVPDWVTEVVSPFTAAHDRVDKAGIYAREAVSFFWLIDPVARTLETHVLEDARWVRTGAWKCDAKVRAVPFDAVELELGELWER